MNKWFKLPDVRFATLDVERQEKFKEQYKRVFEAVNPAEVKGIYLVMENVSPKSIFGGGVGKSNMYLVLEDASSTQETLLIERVKQITNGVTEITKAEDKNNIKDISRMAQVSDFFEFGSDYTPNRNIWQELDFLQRIRETEHITAVVRFEPIDRKAARKYQVKMLERAIRRKDKENQLYYKGLLKTFANMFRVTARIYTDRTNKDNIRNCFSGLNFALVEYNGRPTTIPKLLLERAKEAKYLLRKSGIVWEKHYYASDVCKEFNPFLCDELNDKNGFCYGKNPITHQKIMFDRKHSPLKHGFIFGYAGSGKSYYAEAEMKQILEKTDDDIIIVDPEKYLGNQLHEEITDISLTSKSEQYHINPLDIVFCDYYSDDNFHRRTEIDDKKEYVLSIFGSLLEHDKREYLNVTETNTILHAFHKTFDPFLAMLNKRKAIGDGEWRYDFEQNPTLADFIRKLECLLDDETVRENDKMLIDGVSSLLEANKSTNNKLRKRLEEALVPDTVTNCDNLRYVIAKYGKYLAEHKYHTNISADSRIIRLSFRDGYAKLQFPYYLFASNFIHNRSLLRLMNGKAKGEDYKPVWVYWEEAHNALGNEYIASNILNLMKHARTDLSIHTFISQNYFEVFRTESGRSCINHAGIEWFLELSKADKDKIQALYNLSEKELEHMTMNYYGGVLRIGCKTVLFNTEKTNLSSTKGED